jgi:hypothetical protein
MCLSQSTRNLSTYGRTYMPRCVGSGPRQATFSSGLTTYVSFPRPRWLDLTRHIALTRFFQGINQSDRQERNQQVRIMRQIYKSASRVAIYVGEETEGTQEALQLLGLMNEMSEELSPNPAEPACLSFAEREALPKLAHEWNNFQDFFDRAWFKRLWVLQEVAVATAEPVVICGQYHIPWRVIARVSGFFYSTGLVRATRRVDE